MCYVASTQPSVGRLCSQTLLLTYGSSGNAQLRSVRIIWAVAGAVYGVIAIITNSVIGKKKK